MKYYCCVIVDVGDKTIKVIVWLRLERSLLGVQTACLQRWLYQLPSSAWSATRRASLCALDATAPHSAGDS